MLYKDFVKEKVNNEIRIKSAEGYPCEFERSKGRPLKDYKLYGNSIQDGTPTPDNPIEIQSVGDLTTKNLFDMNKLIEQGWVQQVDGSYYVEKSSTPYQQVLWENAENYIGQLKILFKVKYSIDNKQGCYLWVNYTDGTHLTVYYKGAVVADTWYSPTISRTITDTNKTVKNVTWVYGTTISSTWVKDIIITKDIAVTEYEPYHKYDIPIVVRGKNLIKYPYSQTTKTENGVTFTDNGDGTITVDGTATADTRFYCRSESDKVSISSGTYTISGCPDGGSRTTYYIGGFAYNVFSSGQTFSVTKTTSDWLYIMIKSGVTVNNLIFKPQLELGAAATAYEQYREPITTHIYLDEPLRKIGDYADYIDFKNQKIVKNIQYIKLEPTLDCKIWTYNDTFYGFVVYLTNHINEGRVLSNRFKSVTDNKLPSHKDNSIYIREALYIGTADWITVEDFKIWLSDNITYFAYILKTPTETAIELPPILSQKGTNTIATNATTLPSNIEVKYIAK